MNLLLRGRPKIENRVAEEDSGSLLSPAKWFRNIFAGVETSSGEHVSSENAILHPDVYACVKVLAEDAAKLPIKLFQSKEGSVKTIQNDISRMILHKVNPYMTSFTWKALVMLRMATWGTATIVLSIIVMVMSKRFTHLIQSQQIQILILNRGRFGTQLRSMVSMLNCTIMKSCTSKTYL